MSRYCKFILMLLSVVIFAYATPGELTNEDIQLLFATTGPHPRLLMTEDTAAQVRERINGEGDVNRLFMVLRSEADAMIALPVLKREQTGKRLLSVSREALRRILYLSFVYRMTDNREYADRAIEEMEGAAAFSDWNPSHFLDVAEMTMALAIGYDWLHPLLTPDHEETIRTALLDKGIHPSFEGGQWWVRGDNNWNQVCHGGMVFGALAFLEHEPELAARVISRAVDGLPYAMKEYAPDGIYPEGPSYWEYGTSFNVLLIAALESALGTDCGLTEQPGFLVSGAFPLLMTGPTGKHFNFSDCGTRGGPFPAVYWFAQRTGDRGLAWSEHPWLQAVLEGEVAARNRFLPLMPLWWDGRPPESPAHPLHWKGDGVNPLATHRSSWTDPDAVFLAVKAGTPFANHGHMDIGSFILEADGLRWSVDLGAESYHKLETRGMNIWNRKQDSERWRVYRYHNRSHSTLMVNEAGQVVEGHATITHFSDKPAFPHTIMDMAEVYAGHLSSARRGFALLPDGRVMIQDEIQAGDDRARVRWTMTTPAEVGEKEAGKAVLVLADKQLQMEVLSPAETVVEIFPTDPPNEWDAENPGTCQVGFHVEIEPNDSTTIIVMLTPGSRLQPHVESPEIHPLSMWSQHDS